MSSKHTKAGRRARFRRHHTRLEREPLLAHTKRTMREHAQRAVTEPVWLNARAMMGVAEYAGVIL